ncbi:hypothetical protein KKH56_08850, partial [bacterium]|nr:hypothetical protein [bacterium]
MKEGIKNAVEKYGKILFLAILGAVVVNILLPIHWRFFFAIVVFLVVLNTILEVLEKDNATKRLTKKLLLFGTGLVAFVGLRIAADYLFNMPIIDSFNDLGKVKGITGMAYQGATQALILELMFLLPGIGIAYGLVKGGSKTKGMIYIMSCLMFFVVLWQVKQVEHSKAMKHYAQATIDKQATDLCQAALKKDVNAALTIAVATENINDSIFAGARMAIKGKQITQVGMEPMIEVVLEENGVFNGIEIFVPYRKLRILEKTPTPSTPDPRAENVKENRWWDAEIVLGKDQVIELGTFEDGDILRTWSSHGF